jgi:hypothetical protein
MILRPTSLRIEGSRGYMSAFSPSTVSIHMNVYPTSLLYVFSFLDLQAHFMRYRNRD